MNYLSIEFAVFLMATFVLYYSQRTGKAQVLVLIAASLFFYAWEDPALLAVFLTSWLITSVFSYLVINSNELGRRKVFATAGVSLNLLILCFFKYKTLVDPSLKPGEGQLDSLTEILLHAPLPIGISFYTFHGISLMVDIFRGDRAFDDSAKGGLVRHLLESLLYLVFFPQLISGPIVKAKDFLPQIKLKQLGDIRIEPAVRALIMGAFLKSVIADNLSSQTFWIEYPYYESRSPTELILLLYAYSAQIFADFAGYSLLAIGLGRLMGYELPSNFDFPYAATSISQFWRKWHISLSSWLRDYLYIPLGGSQRGTARTYLNLIITMFLGGLWHGAAWSFAFWGLWHGIGLALERPLLKTAWMSSTSRITLAIRALIVFNFVTFGWLFFKLQDFQHALGYIGHIASGQSTRGSGIMMATVLILSSAVFLYHIANIYRSRISRAHQNTLYGFMLFSVVTSAGPNAPFIYFQF